VFNKLVMLYCIVLYFAIKSHVQARCTEHYVWTTR